MRLYRAMSKEEFNVLRERGFNSTFRKGWKWFATDPRYVYIVTHELNYNLTPETKYTRVVQFDIEFHDIPSHFVRFFCERGYMNVAINRIALSLVKSVSWTELDKDSLPQPEPMLMWISHGKTIQVFDKRKAVKIFKNMIRARMRIIHIHPHISKVEF